MDRQLQQVLKDLSSQSDPSLVPYSDALVMALFATLTYSGTDFVKPFFASASACPPAIASLVRMAEDHRRTFLDHRIWQVLDTSEPPRFRASTLTLLAECDLLGRFLSPLMISRKQAWEPLVTVTTILTTFHLHVLNRVPSVSYAQIVRGLGELTSTTRRMSKLMRFELVRIASEFLANCVAFLDTASIRSAVNPLFAWALLRHFTTRQQLSAAFGPQIIQTIKTSENKSLLFEMMITFVCHSLPSFSGTGEDDPILTVFDNAVLALLRLCVAVTSLPDFGTPTSAFLFLYSYRGMNFPKLVEAFLLPAIPYFGRKLQGYLLRLQSNIAFVVPEFGLANPVPSDAFNQCVGIDSPYVRQDYILDLLSSNLYLPCLNLRFLDLEHYLIDAFALFKATVAFSLWEDLRLCIIHLLNPTSLDRSTRCGSLFPCRVSTNPFVINFQRAPTAPLFLLLQIVDQKVHEITFVRYSESGALTAVSGTVSERLNYLYEMNPATLPSYQILITVTWIYNEFGENLASDLVHIWVGHSDEESIASLQSNLDPSYVFDDLHLFGCVSDGASLVISLEVLHKLGFDFAVEYRTNLPAAGIQLPLSSNRWCTVHFDNDDSVLPARISLTPAQRAAVLSALCFPLTLIVGPPGTGKTETILAITRTLYRNLRRVNTTDKILLCAHSNSALDQMLLAVASSNEFNIFRFGLSPSCQAASDLTAEARIRDAAADLQKLLVANASWLSSPRYNGMLSSLQKITAEIVQSPFSSVKAVHARNNEVFVNMASFLRERAPPTDAVMAICSLLDRLSDRYSSIVQQLSQDALVIGCTITSLSQRLADLRNLSITAVIVEEAAKVLETEMLALLVLAPQRLVFVGDHTQLRPVVTSDDVRLFGRFSQSLFERFQRLGVRTVALNCQGRALPVIADIYRRRYMDVLTDLDAVTAIPDVPFIDRVVQWVDVQAQTRGETNEAEAEFIKEVLRRAKLTGKMDLKIVSIITPYNAQKAMITESLKKESIEPRDICTIDEFQGQQNLVIILSLVAQAPTMFLRDERRITVMMSRTRARLIVFGNHAGFAAVPEWQSVVQAIENANRLTALCIDRKMYRCAADISRDNDALEKGSNQTRKRKD